MTHRRVLHLGDLLGSAEIIAPTPQHVEIQSIDVGGDVRPAIFEHPDAFVRIPLPPTLHDGTLRTACGIASSAWPRLKSTVRFRVGLEIAAGDVEWLHEVTLDPRRHPAHRTWVEVDVRVPGGTAIALTTEAGKGRTAHAWAGWADPVIEWNAPTAPDRRRDRPARRNVLVITADACRADFTATTVPHIDRLADDGLRFTGARTVATSTPGSHASLMSGRYPLGHGVLHEWGTFPASLPSLPTELARAGYRTMFAPSERETGLPEQGFARVFQEVIPCLANPNQDGSVTTRQVLRWLADDDSDRPWFIWASYFDTHPPLRLPDALVAEFYDGDPRDPARADRTEAVQSVHGTESVLSLEAAVPDLQIGRVDPSVVCRLRDTARALEGTLESGPDLASHILALGPGARRDLDPPAMAAWLRSQVRALEQGQVSQELLAWIDDVLPLLRQVERRMLSWIDGVVDYRYIVAQARAATRHVDDQVGALVRHLQDEGLYDECTVVFASPHGELFGEQGHHLEHGPLLEPCLRIPLVVKPAQSLGVATPRTVNGPIENVDVMPTLLAALGFDVPAVEGTSRWDSLAAGHDIPDHDTFAVDQSTVEAGITRGRHKLVRGLAPVGDTGRRRDEAGVTLVACTDDGETPVDDARLVDDLARRLDHWLDERL